MYFLNGWLWSEKGVIILKEIGMKGIYYAYENRFNPFYSIFHPMLQMRNRYTTPLR